MPLLYRAFHAGKKVKACVEALPHINLDAAIQPITRSVLRVSVTLTPEFTWRDSQHGGLQRWWGHMFSVQVPATSSTP
jgi:hypothetical protein